MSGAQGWQPIATAPAEDGVSFLVRVPGPEGEPLVLQTSRFEGNLYPDHLGCDVDFLDRITTAKEWCPIP